MRENLKNPDEKFVRRAVSFVDLKNPAPQDLERRLRLSSQNRRQVVVANLFPDVDSKQPVYADGVPYVASEPAADPAPVKRPTKAKQLVLNGTLTLFLGMGGFVGAVGCGGNGNGSPTDPTTPTFATLSVFNTGDSNAGSAQVEAGTRVTLDQAYLSGLGINTGLLDIKYCGLWKGNSQAARGVGSPVSAAFAADQSYKLVCGAAQDADANASVVSQGMGHGVYGRDVPFRLIRVGEQMIYEGRVVATGKVCDDPSVVQRTIDAFNSASTFAGRQWLNVSLVGDAPRVIGCADIPGNEGLNGPTYVLTEKSETIMTLLRELEERMTGTQNVTTDGTHLDRVTGSGYTPLGKRTLGVALVLSP